MNQNPIENVLDELNFSKVEREGFLKFLNYAKICQETGNNNELKFQLEEIVKEVVSKP